MYMSISKYGSVYERSTIQSDLDSLNVNIQFIFKYGSVMIIMMLMMVVMFICKNHLEIFGNQKWKKLLKIPLFKNFIELLIGGFMVVNCVVNNLFLKDYRLTYALERRQFRLVERDFGAIATIGFSDGLMIGLIYELSIKLLVDCQKNFQKITHIIVLNSK